MTAHHPAALDETPILVATLADTIGTSPEDVAEHLDECDEVNKEHGLTEAQGLTHLLRELVEVG